MPTSTAASRLVLSHHSAREPVFRRVGVLRRVRAVRTLSRRELNRALHARQLLLERADATLPDALERVCGIQAQYAPSMYECTLVRCSSDLQGFMCSQAC